MFLMRAEQLATDMYHIAVDAKQVGLTFNNRKGKIEQSKGKERMAKSKGRSHGEKGMIAWAEEQKLTISLWHIHGPTKMFQARAGVKYKRRPRLPQVRHGGALDRLRRLAAGHGAQ